MIRKINDERQDERRQTNLDNTNILRNLDKAKKEKEDLQRFLEETEQ